MSHSRPILAIYGGTFDPFHLGHEAICKQILAQPQVARLHIVPCHIPALKPEAMTHSKHRFNMLNDWVLQESDVKRVVVEDIEIQRGGPSYTVDSVAALKAKYPQSRLIFILGMDAWRSLPKWHGVLKLVSEVSFWVFNRQGETLPSQNLVEHESESLSQFLTLDVNGFYVDSSVDVAVASSKLRSKKVSSEWAVPKSIKDYINLNELYQ